MSSAKETPRQKMIGMMYLVLTCLLALNVSREVLQGFVTINESIETTNSNFTANTKLMMEALDVAIKQGHPEAKPYYEKAKEATQLTQRTYDYISILKQQVKQYTESVKGADTMKLSQIERLDDYDKPTFFLIGSDETKPKTGQYSAKELRGNIEKLTSELNKMIDFMKDKDGLKLPNKDYLILKDKLKLFTPHDNFRDKEGHPQSWELKNFYNMPLAAVVTNLSKIQSDIRNIEAELVNTFASASGKLAIKFNRMEARIVPVSQYVQSGSPYTADVFLSASSSEFNEDNLQFILGDVDTATGKISEGATILPIDKGTGKITLPTGGSGHKEINGWIKLKNGVGKTEYYKYQNEYIVAPSAVAVSAEKMNVLYIGAENPLNISAAGVAPSDLVVVISGCGATLVNSGNGKYIAKATATGTCIVTVMQKTPTGMKQQGLPVAFRVKKFPNPPLRVNGKTTFGNLEMALSDVKNITSIGTDNGGFDFLTTFKVTEFKIAIYGNGVAPQEFKCPGNSLTMKAKEALNNVKKGYKIYLEDIKVQGPDGLRDLPNTKITVK
ncbi:MAG: gliding motility protein GldM [Bacteroidota bacterium]|nr:gliding motility protein GldM [Bacteroidota bacterium]